MNARRARSATIDIDAIPAPGAIVDRRGRIVAVNEAWREAAVASGWHAEAFGVGLDYLGACDQAGAAAGALEAGKAIRSLLASSAPMVQVEYECTPPGGPKRWFMLAGVPVSTRGAQRFAILHFDITQDRAERTTLEEGERLWRGFFEHNPAIVLLVDPATGRIVEASEAAATFYGYPRGILRGKTIADINMLEPADVARRMLEAFTTEGGCRNERMPHRLASGEVRTVDVSAGRVLFGSRLLVQAIVHDATDVIAVEVERDRLVAAVEQGSESVVVTDAEATIVYVNPAFERVTGYSRSEVIGKNPRILQSGEQSAEFYAAMWSALTAGVGWHGELVNRRKDGSRLIEEASINPVFAEDGTLLHYVAVKRDVTAARSLQARLDVSTVGGGMVSSMIANLVPGPSPEATAEQICDRTLTLPGVAFAAIAQFLPGDGVRLLAALAADRSPIPPIQSRLGHHPGRRRTSWLRTQLARGPLFETVAPSPSVSPMGATFGRLGIGALATVPIRAGSDLIGFLQVGSASRDGRGMLQDSLPTIEALGILAAVLLGPGVSEQVTRDAVRDEVASVIQRHRFHPVFQPIVVLSDGRIVGYEALTRFSGSIEPAEMFERAAAAGLGIDLELATLTAALEASANLPPDTWLDVNVSPRLLQDPSSLARVLPIEGSRPLVIEITEHDAIEDYIGVRNTLRGLGIPVRIAIDDAGAGYASMRHILELRPDIIKLDRSFISGMDVDPARQGLVAGLHHFASVAGARLIAEGVETPAERATLMGLGVEYGQGYLFGRPMTAGRVRRVASRPDRRRSGSPVGNPPDHILPELVRNVSAILWEADGTEGKMRFVSEAAATLTGHAPKRWLGEPAFWEEHLHPDDRARVLETIERAMSAPGPVALEYRFRLADGSYRWFQDQIEMHAERGHLRLLGVMVDVTDRRALEDQLAHRATHDPLTELYNRQGFYDLVGSTITIQPGHAGAMILLDLDGFKQINDTAGHAVGDDVLRAVATRLRASVRATDIVARLGGDEFVIFTIGHDDQSLLDLAERVAAVVGVPAESNGRVVAPAVSVGFAMCEQGEPVESAIHRADQAMYRAKRNGGSRMAVHDERGRVGPGRRSRSRPGRVVANPSGV